MESSFFSCLHIIKCNSFGCRESINLPRISSPRTTPTLRFLIFNFSATAKIASRHAIGLTPPPFVITLIFFCTISGRISVNSGTKSLAYPRFPVSHLLLLQDRHCDFCKIVHHHIIDGTISHLVDGRSLKISPKALSACYAN